MRLHRFYLNEHIHDSELLITDERLVHQWKKVFRYGKGDKVILFDGSGKEFVGEIQRIENKEWGIKVLEEKEGVVPKIKITLYQSLIKKDNVEWIVEKATELGVSKIVPIISERSEKKGFNIERASKIAIEASEQCGRADVPEITGIMNIEEGIVVKTEKAIAFDPSGTPFPYSSLVIPYSHSIFIGPEGGWSPAELEKFKEVGVEIYSLGPLTLRAETAAIVALSRM